MAEPTPTIDSASHKLEHTPSGTPYIALTTRAQVPIYLTKLRESDVEAMQRTAAIDAIGDNLIGLPKPYTLDDAKWWLDKQLSGQADLPLTCLRASDPETGPFIGSIGLAPHDGPMASVVREQKARVEGQGRDVDLGYYLHPDWQGKGIMKSAVQAIVDWGKNYESVRTVFVRVLQENVASMRIVTSLPQFVRCNGEDDFQQYPENKGGRKRRMYIWEWKL
ncbi:hypothetical protein LHYA1_G007540 [Lachnellula hyalina]|uniref:N-acetyltransferase domain-containing protein n=1 Tax=Lachnellula hyalina TaxID=1316788 RepID=A0A8H8QW23_9HELO|nr:uncharacterized protein LHYA1_G007540 [Lachnellula hyalina]TVY23581.1 hypothetical protein LHYA1_G007540 [Lachnellula hyalina]